MRAVPAPLVSIVVPVRRTTPEYVGECLESVARQTAVEACELVVVDNASGSSYARELDRIVAQVDDAVPTRRVARKRPGGPGDARAAGADASSGDYIFFLDSDDIIEPRMVEAVRPALEGGCAMAYTNEARVEADGRTLISVRDKRPYAALHAAYAGTPHDPMIHCTFVVHTAFTRRDVLEAIGGPRTDLPYGDEMDRPIRVAEVASPDALVLVPETLYYWRQNPLSLIHQEGEWARKIVPSTERIVLEGAQRRGVDVVRAARLGRARPSDLTHYALFGADGRQLRVPYFDYEELSLRSSPDGAAATAAS